MTDQISGATAAEIADSVRALRDRGALRSGDPLPPVRELAARLGVNRNTAVAAYRQLAQAGLVTSRGRAGTVVAGLQSVPQEGYAGDTVLRDLGTGNPDPRLIPDPGPVIAEVVGRPVLYGEPVIDAGLEEWARVWMRADLRTEAFGVTVTGGAVDAVERLLAQALLRDDAVALEDPCFLASIQTVRLGGYRAVPVPVDEQGMTVEGLRAALAEGVRAVICTPRAQNPTGASLSAQRAAELRSVLAQHPYVLVIEDDHFSLLSQRAYQSLIGPEHRRFALIRSVSKFLGPDMGLAITAADPETTARLGLRLSPGTTWVSHLLQRLALALLTNGDARAAIDAAGRHYAERNAAVAARLRRIGLDVPETDGLSLWVGLPETASVVSARLMRRGWLVRTGDDFVLDRTDASSHRVRLTVHDLAAEEVDALIADLSAALP